MRKTKRWLRGWCRVAVMSNVCLELEKLRVSSSLDRIRLFVGTHLEFMCVDADFCSHQRGDLLDLLLSHEVWVCRGKGCCLNFTILINDNRIPPEDAVGVSERLGAHLRDQSFWSQLLLEANLHLPNDDTDQKYDFSLKINHNRQDTAETEPNAAIFAAPSDMKPPAEIQCFEIENIDIVMNFKKFPSAIPSGPHNNIGPDEGSMLLDDDHDPVDEEIDFFSDTSQLEQFMFDNNFESLIDQDLNHYDEKRLLNHTESTNNLLTPPSSQKNQDSQQDGKITNGNTHRNRIIGLGLNVDSSCLIASFALRSLIGGKQDKCDQRGMKVWKNTNLITLSKIAPALWSPGFLEDMSHSSRFISSISSAFSTSMLRDAQSPSLRQKLLSLQKAVTPSQPTGSKICHSTQSKGVNEAIQARLWKMMEKSLYDDHAARKLRVGLADDENKVQNHEGDDRSMIDISQDEEPQKDIKHATILNFGRDEFDGLLDDPKNVETTEDLELDFLIDYWGLERKVEKFENILSDEESLPVVESFQFSDILQEHGDDTGTTGEGTTETETKSQQETFSKWESQMEIDDQEMLL